MVWHKSIDGKPIWKWALIYISIAVVGIFVFASAWGFFFADWVFVPMARKAIANISAFAVLGAAAGLFSQVRHSWILPLVLLPFTWKAISTPELAFYSSALTILSDLSLQLVAVYSASAAVVWFVKSRPR